MKYSETDTRPLSDKERELAALDRIHSTLKTAIASYAIESNENLFDEEANEIIRRLEFSQGTRSYDLVICPDGFMRMITDKFPPILLTEIHNALIRRSPPASQEHKTRSQNIP